MQKNPLQVVEKLLKEGQIRAQLVIECSDILRLCRNAQNQLGRRAGRQVHNGIYQEDSAQQDGYGQQDPLNDILIHMFSSLCFTGRAPM